MGVSYVYGPANSGKSISVYKKVLALAAKDLNSHYIIVTPEQYALSVERQLVELSEGGGIINIEVLSFSRLAYRIMEEAGDKMKPVMNDIGKSMLIRNIMQDLKGELCIFMGKDKNLGFIDEIKSVISELCQYRITPEALEKSAGGESEDKSQVLKLKLKDISLIYKEFNKRVDELNYTTAESMTELCFKHISGNAWLKDTGLFFDGFTGFTPIQYEFIERLMIAGCNLEFIVTADKEVFSPSKVPGLPFETDRGNTLFDMSTEMVGKLNEMAVKNGYIPVMPEYVAGNYCASSIEFLKNSIFRFKGEKYGNDGSISIYSAKNYRAEIINAASKISDAIRNNPDYRYSDFAIVCGDLGACSAYIEEVFEKYSIPVYIDENKNILSNPLICFIENALEVAENNYRKDSVIAFAKSPILNYGNEIYEFENYLLSKNIRGKSAYARVWDNKYRGSVEPELGKINKIRLEINACIKLLDAAKDELTAEKMCETLKKLLEKCNAKQRLEELAEKLDNSVNDGKRLKKEYDKVYDTVDLLLDQISVLLKEEKLDFRQFRDIFKAGASKIKLGRIPQQNDVVLAGDIKRTRLSNVKQLFMVGVNDGVVPPVYSSSGLLSLDERTKLSAEGIELAEQPENKPEREEYYIYLALSKPLDKLFISFSRNTEKKSEENGALKPSYIIEQITDCIEGLEIKEFVQEKPSDFLYEYAGLTGENLDEAIGFAEYPIFENIEKELCKELYGKILNSSFSKIRTFSECNFKYFCQYGLELSPRPEAKPQAFDYGLVIHDALRKYMSGLKDSGIDWKKAKAEDYSDKAKEALYNAVSEYRGINYLSDKRLENYVKRMEKVMEIVTKAIHSQLSCGDFKPEYFEKSFKISDKNLIINGIIDRIDAAEINGKKLLKLIDYKTGKYENFDPTLLYYGIQLQLPLYMKEISADSEVDGEAVLAFYQHVLFDDKVERGPKTIPENKRIKELRPKGMFNVEGDVLNGLDNHAVKNSDNKYVKMNSDAADFTIDENGYVSGSKQSAFLNKEDFDMVCDFAEDTIRSMSDEIMNGRDDINPYLYNDADACKYCDFKGVCGFDPKQKCYLKTIRILMERTVNDIKEKLKDEKQ